jgi:hypothetical protein
MYSSVPAGTYRVWGAVRNAMPVCLKNTTRGPGSRIEEQDREYDHPFGSILINAAISVGPCDLPVIATQKGRRISNLLVEN